MMGLLDSTAISFRTFPGPSTEIPVVLVFQLSAGASISDAVEDIIAAEKDFAGFEEVSDTDRQLVTITPIGTYMIQWYLVS